MLQATMRMKNMTQDGNTSVWEEPSIQLFEVDEEPAV